MIPVSAKDMIEFRPAAARIARAAAEVETAKNSIPFNQIAVDAAEMALADAELAQEERDPVYRLRVPTMRSKARVDADLTAEAIVPKYNSDVVAAILSSGEVSPEDEEFLRKVDTNDISHADWTRIYWLARSIPESARILANWSLHRLMLKIHKIRHHLILDGERSPVSEASIEALPDGDAAEIAEKIDDLMTPTKAEAKN